VERTGTGRPVDAIISPAVAYAAVPHGLNTYVVGNAPKYLTKTNDISSRDSFYTTLCNAMDYTTSVFPVTHVDPQLDVPLEPHSFYNHEDEAIFKLCT
jgi:amidase